ncbi:hypothetical protein [Nevskia ramosa]|uniref:hypothetical protein n=1 Tax=Nevskia ramosa TaxID=64002 RepID=UPI00235317A4|nr:hypothetical protein [Nevskia ramosa]
MSLNTISKLLTDLGAACAEHQDAAFKNLPCIRIQRDEIWSFVLSKEKNALADVKVAGMAGDACGSGRRSASNSGSPLAHFGPNDAAN